MSVFFGWAILGLLAALVSFLPPIFMARVDMFKGYWECFKDFNLFLWGFLLGIGTITGLLMLSLTLLGVVHW